MARHARWDARQYDPRGVPSREEELELARRVKAGDAEARAELIERNRPLAIHFAASALPPHLRGEEDAYQEAFAGLIRAVDGYDPESGNTLATYARGWIVRHVKEWWWAHDKTIKLPSLWHRANGSADADAWDRVMVGIASLDYRMPHGENGATTLGDMIPDDSPRADRRAELADELQRLAEFVERLRHRDRLVIVRRFGLDGGGARKLDEVADELGVTKEYVRQLQVRALARLRWLAARESA